jgi:hypothetical protein
LPEAHRGKAFSTSAAVKSPRRAMSKLEPTIGLEPMICRLRIVAGAQRRTTLAV